MSLLCILVAEVSNDMCWRALTSCGCVSGLYCPSIHVDTWEVLGRCVNMNILCSIRFWVNRTYHANVYFLALCQEARIGVGWWRYQRVSIIPGTCFTYPVTSRSYQVFKMWHERLYDSYCSLPSKVSLGKAMHSQAGWSWLTYTAVLCGVTNPLLSNVMLVADEITVGHQVSITIIPTTLDTPQSFNPKLRANPLCGPT